MDYIYHLLILITIYVTFVSTMNVIVGNLGILYLGHPAMFGIGAYTFAILTTQHGYGFFTALLAAGIITALAGFLLALPTLRLKSHYIGMATLGFLMIVHGLFVNLRDLTRGALGIPGIPKPNIFGHSFSTNLEFLLVSLLICALIGAIFYRIINSPFGKVIETIREDETAAKTLGKNTAKYKIQAFVLISFFAGIMGGVYASYIGFISPWNFALDQLIILIAAVIIGGMASFWGSVVGAALIILLPEPLRFMDLPTDIVGAMRNAIYGLLVILFMIFKPNGILGKRTNIFSK